MRTVKQALIALYDVVVDNYIVAKHAKEEYEKKFSRESIPHGSYHYYSGFQVLDSERIKVNYKWGAGEMEYDDHFIVIV